MNTTDTTIFMHASAVPHDRAPNMRDVLIGFPKSFSGNARLQTLVKQHVAVFETSLGVDDDFRSIVVTNIVSICLKEDRRFVRYQTLGRGLKTVEWACELSLAQAVAFTNHILDFHLTVALLRTPQSCRKRPTAATGYPLGGANHRPKEGPSRETGSLAESSHSSVEDDHRSKEGPSTETGSLAESSHSSVEDDHRPKERPSKETGSFTESSHSSVEDDAFPPLKLVSFDDWSEQRLRRKQEEKWGSIRRYDEEE